jgi:hypothetical protein
MRHTFTLTLAAVLAVLTWGCLSEASAASRSGYPSHTQPSYWRHYGYPRPNCTFAISEYQRRWSGQLWPPSMRCRPYPH